MRVGEKRDLSKHASGKKANGSKNAVSNFGKGTFIQELDKYQYRFIATQTFIQLQALHVAQKMVTDAMEFSVSSG